MTARIIRNPTTPRQARAAAEQIAREHGLRVSTTSEVDDGWLQTLVWTVTPDNARRVAATAAARHSRAQVTTGVTAELRQYVLIKWRQVS